MSVLAPGIIDGVIQSGPLTKARNRIQDGSARPRNRAEWDKFSTWSLVCEEVLDTEHNADWYDDIIAELIRRGFTFDQIDSMRRFAWETAGWLNFDKMLWDWCHLDEKDIQRALDWQREDSVITPEEYDRRIKFLHNPQSR